MSFTAEPGAIVGLIGANGSARRRRSTSSRVWCGRRRAPCTRRHRPPEYLPEERLGVGMPLVPRLPALPRLSALDAVLLSEDARRRLPSSRRRCGCRGPGRRTTQTGGGGRGHRRLRAGALPESPNRRALDGHPPSRGPGLHRAGPSPAPAARRADSRDRPAGARRSSRSCGGCTRSPTRRSGWRARRPLVFELCSTVVVMELGRVVASGPPAEVRADPKALAAYLGASDEALIAFRTDRRSRGEGHIETKEGDGGRDDEAQRPRVWWNPLAPLGRSWRRLRRRPGPCSSAPC